MEVSSHMPVQRRYKNLMQEHASWQHLVQTTAVQALRSMVRPTSMSTVHFITQRIQGRIFQPSLPTMLYGTYLKTPKARSASTSSAFLPALFSSRDCR